MSLSTTASKVQYSPNGSTTVFPFALYFLDAAHLVVTLTDATGVDTLQVITVNYTVQGVGTTSGGQVTMNVAPASGTTLTIKRVVPITQLVHYVPTNSFPATTHEQALDRLTMVCQQLAELFGRCVQFQDGETVAVSPVLPNKTARANKTLAFDGSGNLTVI